MTVPAISPAVAPASTPTAPMTSRDAIQEAIGEAWRETMVGQGTPEADLARDDKGRFVPREESDATTDDSPYATDEEKAAAAAKAPVVEEEQAKGTDGDTVVLPEADPAELATHFVLKDETGELAIPKGLKITFQANGKVREESLDKVVRLAEMGVYNHEREQRRQQTEGRALQLEQTVQTVQKDLSTRDQQLEQLLADPAFYQRAVQEYHNQNTPEAQAQRLQAERAQFQLEQERAQIAPANQRYLEQEIGPSIELVIKSLPNVEAQEVISRVERFIRTKQGRGGYVHPSQHAAINDYFLNEIVPWARQVDEYRAVERGTRSGRQQVEASKGQDKQKADELAAQQAKTQKVRRQAVQNLTPPSKGAAPAAIAAKPIKNHADAVQSAIDSALSMTLGRA